jgi:hypothetical protein
MTTETHKETRGFQAEIKPFHELVLILLGPSYMKFYKLSP